MKKKKNRKLKKEVIYFLFFLILIIPIIFFIHTFFNNSSSSNTSNNNSSNTSIILTETEQKLQELSYSEEEIELVEKYVSDENISYILTSSYSKDDIISFINETYYIDEYLSKYLAYQKENPSYSYSEIVTRINTHLDDEFYTNTEKTDTTLGKFVILNKHYYSDSTYPSETLVKVDASYNLYNTSFYLQEECYEAFLKMYEDAQEAGYGFKINSAYRSYEKQIKIYQGWVDQDGKDLADTYSARAGYSEHQTGYAFDIRDYPFTNDDYSKTKSFTWVSQNAYKYGFILRFPEGKEYITGYQYESWHYRYCGIECSTYIHKTSITFEEYYEYFIRFHNPKNLS